MLKPANESRATPATVILFLRYRQVGEDLEVGLAGQVSMPLVLGQIATGDAVGERQQVLNL